MYIEQGYDTFKQKFGNVQVSAFAPLLSDQMIIDACAAAQHRYRSSPFPPSGCRALNVVSSITS